MIRSNPKSKCEERRRENRQASVLSVFSDDPNLSNPSFTRAGYAYRGCQESRRAQIIKETYTGAMVSAGPGRTERVGKAAVAHYRYGFRNMIIRREF